MTDEQWSNVPWESFTAEGWQLAWRKKHVPYLPKPNALETLDIWIPSSGLGADAPAADTLPTRGGPWVIYIHGGAWRDPAITASSFEATVASLLSSGKGGGSIGGLASLSYSLSPHPTHIDPSPPKDPAQQPDPSRMAKHPDHINDVLTGLAYLQNKAGFGNNYVLIGHSCGATLAFQAAMKSSRWGGESTSVSYGYVKKPKIIVGLNGLYDLPSLIKNPGEKHAHVAPVYEAFTRLAFGDSETDWKSVSPAYVGDWAGEWDGGSKVVLGQSLEDSLVPYNQTEGMLASLKKSVGDSIKVEEVKVTGDHNEIWQGGQGISEIVSGLLKEM